MSEYTAREWQNGKPCPQHSVPYCTPCFKALVSMSGENPYKERQQEAFDALRANIIDRLMGRTNDTLSQQEFSRPKTARNFLLDSRKHKFAASCQMANENCLVVPLEFVIIGDNDATHKADDDETRAILMKEHLWDISTPEWMQHDVALKLDYEDNILLREFQLFKA